MEPNKMEEEFRKKLNAREIQPSDAAWDRLDAMLSIAENKKPKRNFRWLHIAASVVFFLGVGLFLMNQETESNVEIPMSNNDVVTVEPSENGIDVSGNNDIVKSVPVQEAVAENKSVQKEKVVVKIAPQHFAKQEVTVEEKVTTEEVQKVSISPESMLASVDATKEKPKVKVNASSLLSAVEGELNQEFRETKFDKIQKKFEAVKTAVANRNYE
ncbi:hypothetical protein [Flavobacterium sp.]|uniref:hypothetical protein n=1 Tax=Flavobacterium sp. TaxID=239 RepID=UPI0028BDABB6|nr:hypothetical protein [Flavobacterium sp.]